jgi:hypothetical protein
MSFAVNTNIYSVARRPVALKNSLTNHNITSGTESDVVVPNRFLEKLRDNRTLTFEVLRFPKLIRS